MGNCSCLERARVMAWDDKYDDLGLPAVRSGAARGVVSAGNGGGGGMRVKIRMTKGQLRRLLENASRGGASDEDVVAEIMSMGTVRVDVAELRLRQAAERHRRPPMLETIQEDDVDE
ncbi:unnamed protein product [Urochloa decumbens]|uniref:DUF7890 domain-containing protein n=1 Tax=Urochloa decumbens TaxID=240449 RepID=A0ABC9GQ78_9POAL